MPKLSSRAGDVLREVRAYFAYRRQTRTDSTPLLVIASLVFLLVDRPVSWLAARLGSDLGRAIAELGDGGRLLWIGAPAALATLVGAWGLDWWSIRRNPFEYRCLRQLVVPPADRETRD